MRITSVCLGMFLVSCVLHSSPSRAQLNGCTINKGQKPNYLAYNPNLYSVTNWTGMPPGGVVTVPANAQIGDVLLTLVYSGLPDPRALQSDPKEAGRFIPVANCGPGTSESFKMTGASQGMAGGKPIYATEVSNIGYRAYYPTDQTGGEISKQSTAKWSFLYVPYGDAKIEFVLTSYEWSALANNSTVRSGEMAYTVVNATWGKDQLLRYHLPSAITFVPEPCQFTTDKDMKIHLDTVSIDAFPDINSKSDTRPFSMSMRCHKGAIPPLITFRGDADDSNMPGVIKNSIPAPDGSRGITIFLEHRPFSGSAVPVDLSGAKPITDGLRDAGDCGTVNCKNWDLELQAGYIRTSRTISPGNISTKVVVTIEYQ